MRTDRAVFCTRSRGTIACLGWSLLCAAGAYAVLADAPMVAYLTLAGLIPAILLKRGIKSGTRVWVYTTTVAMVLTVILNEVYELDNQVFFAPANLLVPFLLAMGIGLCYVETRKRVVTVIIVCSLTAMIFSGTALSNQLHIRLLFMQDILPTQLYAAFNDRHIIFVFATILQAGGILMLLVHEEQFSRDQRRHSRSTYVKGAFVTFLAHLMVFALGAMMIWSVQIMFPRIDALLSPTYSSLLQGRRGTRIFDEEVSLNQTQGQKQGDQMNTPALRVRSPIPPGYLRGRVYVSYQAGKWTAAPVDQPLSLLRQGGGISAKRYVAGTDTPESMVPVDIYLEPMLHSDVLLLPGNTRAIELIAERLHYARDGIFKPDAWDRSGAYTAYSPRIDQTAAWDQPPPDDRYLAIPDDLRIELNAELRNIGIPPGNDIAERVQRISEYVRNHCSYTLDYQYLGEKDPVLAFLQDHRQGHCELFASGTALLLRAQGIHSRYVTGFVCLRNQSGTWWVANFGDCHAWVEAWIPGQGWQWVEPTPASGIPDSTPQGNPLVRHFHAWVALARHAFAKVKRGYFADVVFDILGALWKAGIWLFVSGPWYLSWGAVAWILAWGIRHYQRRRHLGPQEMQRRELREIAKALETFLARHGIQRHPAMSFREAAAQAEKKQMPRANEFHRLILDYEGLRYRPNPSTENLQKFLQRVKSWCRAKGVNNS